MIKEGIINLLKPAGMTSHDAVQLLRRLTGVKRIGHTGTLDPMAVGVLPLCIGSAARITEYLDLDYKKYRCEMQLGLLTDTQDIWGTVIRDIRSQITTDSRKIRNALRCLQGTISQYPPDYSAVRVNGRRLYEYARQGESVEIRPREVNIKCITVIHVDSIKKRVTFDVECSKGTYIRAICHDVGKILGCGAAMSCLIRTASGAFTLENTVTIEELTKGKQMAEITAEHAESRTEAIEQYLMEPDYPLVHFGKALVNEERGKWFVNGGHLKMSDIRILQEPEFKDKNGWNVREEYKKAYNIYMEKDRDSGLSEDKNPGFLGVAFYSEQYKKLVADKIFIRYGN